MGLVLSVLETEARKTVMTTVLVLLLLGAVPMVYIFIRGIFFPPYKFKLGLPQFSPVFTMLMARLRARFRSMASERFS